MKYTEKTFTITAPGTDKYRNNWDRIFGPKPKAVCVECGKNMGMIRDCQLCAWCCTGDTCVAPR